VTVDDFVLWDGVPMPDGRSGSAGLVKFAERRGFRSAACHMPPALLQGIAGGLGYCLGLAGGGVGDDGAAVEWSTRMIGSVCRDPVYWPAKKSR
jgi:hypothetical protein